MIMLQRNGSIYARSGHEAVKTYQVTASISDKLAIKSFDMVEF